MLTFQNPALLWGLLLLAGPIILHLIHRSLFRPQPFPSLRFIRQGKFPLDNKRRLRDVFLLLSRLLLLALLIGALAGPRWTPPSALAGDGALNRPPLRVLLVDLSASMGGWEQLTESREIALSLLDQWRGEPVALILSADGLVSSISPTLEHNRVRQALRDMSIRPVTGNHRESLRHLYQISAPFRPHPGVEVHVLSDRQEASWNTAQMLPAPSAIDWQWHRTGPDERANSGILSARSRPSSEDQMEVVVEVRNFGRAAESRELTLNIGDQSIARTLELPPRQTLRTTFLIPSHTTVRGMVELDADEYPGDDRYHFWAGRLPPLPVLLIDVSDIENLPSEEAFFLEQTLRVRTEADWLDFEVRRRTPNQLTTEDWERVEVIFLLGSGHLLPDEQWSELTTRVGQGALLFVTPGRQPARQNNRLREAGLLDLETIGIVSPSAGQRQVSPINWINPETPLGRLFREEDSRALFLVNLFRTTQIRVDPEEATVLLRNENEDPLLLEKPFHDGRILFSAVAFDTTWSDLPLSGAFLPLIRESLTVNLSPDHGITRFSTGTSAERLAERLGVSPTHRAITSLNTEQPQVLDLLGQPVEINLPREESTLGYTATLDLEAALATRSREVQETPAETALAALSISWRSTLLWWGALFFLAELLLSAWGRPRPRTENPVT